MKQELYLLQTSSPIEILATEDRILRDKTQHKPVLVLSQISGFILGTDDLKHDHYQRGYQSIQTEPVFLRSVGGKAVYSDGGVLNLSYIIEDDRDFHTIYTTIAHEIIRVLSPLNLTIAIGEIKGSYCPGRYDLSVNGKKIGGIAQKRVGKRYCVSAYLAVNGNQDYRSMKVKKFYEVMGLDFIQTDSMTCLQDLLGKTLSVFDIVTLFEATCTSTFKIKDDEEHQSLNRITQAQQKLHPKP